MTDIFTEVEEELRRDKYNTLLRRYGLWVGGAALLVVLVVAGYELAWEPWREARVDEAAATYTDAVEAGETGDAAALEAVASGEHDGYAALALMQLGAQAAEAGEPARAASYYNRAAERAEDDALSGLARIRALYALSGELSYDELVARAEPLAREADPYRFSARELIGLGALRAGDLERARSEFQYLTLAPQTPPGIRRRAQEALAAVDRAAAQAPAQADAPAEPDSAPAAPAPAPAETAPAQDAAGSQPEASGEAAAAAAQEES